MFKFNNYLYSVKPAFTALGFYVLLTVICFYPVLGSISSSLIGPPEDNMQFVWFLWHGTKSLLDGSIPFMHSSLIYYPEGVNLFYANYFYYGIFWTIFLEPIMGLISTYNLLILSSFPLSGFSMWWLLRYLKCSQWTACLGGFIYAFSPYHYGHALHHPTIASTQFLPLIILFYLKSCRLSSYRNAMVAGIFIALSALCDWNYFLFGQIFLAMGLVYYVIFKRMLKNRQIWLLHLVMVMSASIPLLFWLIPMIYLGLKANSNLMSLPGHDIFVADLAGFFIPHPMHWLSSMSLKIQNLNKLMTGNDWEKAVYLGFVNMVIVLASLKYLWKSRRGVVLGFLVFGALSLGVSLHVLGNQYTIPMPYQLFENTPFLKQARNPSRMMALGYIFWAALVAFALDNVVKRIDQHQIKKIFVAAISFFIILDFSAITHESTPMVLPNSYQAILDEQKGSEEEFAIMTIPWEGGRHMMYQTLHGLPDVQGYIGRKTKPTLIGRVPFELNRLNEQQKLLIENKVKYIVLNKTRLDLTKSTPEYVKAMKISSIIHKRTYSVLYEDEYQSVFRVY